jgi:hypothetical protein
MRAVKVARPPNKLVRAARIVQATVKNSGHISSSERVVPRTATDAAGRLVEAEISPRL